MSCAKPSHNTEATTEAACRGEREEHERFCADMANGLHAMAQPLTILRSAVALLAMAGGGETDSVRYVELSTRQIDRACQIFASLQDLVASQLIPAKEEPIELESLLAETIQDRIGALDTLGIGITAPATDGMGRALGDRRRMAQALAAAIETAAATSGVGAVIQVDASAVDGFIECAIRTTRRKDNDLNSSNRLTLALVKVNMQSQQGRYHFNQEPFRISLALPAYQNDPQKSETICCETCTA